MILKLRSVYQWLAVCLVLGSSQVQAFGADGHRIVVAIAKTHISPVTAAAIKGIAGDTDLGQLSLWPDSIRHLPVWEQSKYWHYVSIDDHEQFHNLQRNADGDVLSALDHFYTQLQNPDLSPRQQLEALAFLMHLVADIHQPLYVGRRDDRGGNSIGVKWLDQKKTTNLHRVWDGLLLDLDSKSPEECGRQLNTTSMQQVAQWQSSTVLDWAKESKALRTQIYNFRPVTQSRRTLITQTYIERNRPIVELRLLMAGVRLAASLNRLFDPKHQQQKQ